MDIALIFENQLSKDMCSVEICEDITELSIRFRKIVMDASTRQGVTRADIESMCIKMFRTIATCASSPENPTAKDRYCIVMKRSTADKLHITPIREATEEEQKKYTL